MSDLPIIDPQAIESLKQLNPEDNGEFLREIAGIFLDDTPQRITELDTSLAGADVPRFVRAAHSIKGSSANMGALHLRAAAEKLEHHAKDKGLNDVSGMISDVKAEWVKAEAAIKDIIKAS